MSIALVPETAPFSDEQRSWLNGFFAGMLGVDPAANGNAVLATATGLLDSQPPTEEPAEEFPWHDPALPIDQRMQLADEKPLERKLMAAMAQLDCGACGYECKSYSEAIASGDEKNLTLCSPGGKETARMLKQVLKSTPATARTTSANATGSAVAAANGVRTMFSRDNPGTGYVIRSRNLNKGGSAKRTHHVEIDLNGSGISYHAGDALGVFPNNCDDLVAEIIEALQAAPDESVQTSDGKTTTLRQALRSFCDLNTVTEELIVLLADVATDDAEATGLRRMTDDADRFEDQDVLDLLSRFPSARPNSAQLVSVLDSLRPRLYSIASSQKKHTGQVHLTVSRVAYEAGGRQRKGVASTMLADRVAPGDLLRIFVHPSKDFTVPADGDAPIIMVGPGTGIAPFMAFLQERNATGASGKNWLFFGDQRRDSDFLYEDELTRYVESGLLTRLDTAFSRDQAEKVYVQDRMREDGAELYAWLQAGGYFFVCGDASRMAVDVDKALKELVAEHGEMSPVAADEYVAELAAQKRYVRDVY